ncbi:MAG: hypothetical protein K9K32_00170 [Halanaerobiales bacterium]|nr:hypothetical protein [Halanaerobiales bacterium]
MNKDYELAQIKAQKRDNRFLITDLINFMDYNDIKNKYNKFVADDYFNKYPHMLKESQGIKIVDFKDELERISVSYFYRDHYYSLEQYRKTIKKVKECGKNLIDSIQKCRHVKEFTVTI